MDVRSNFRLVLDAYVVAPFGYLPRSLRVPRDRDLIVGRGTRIDGRIDAGGRVILCNGAQVRDGISCDGDLVVGARSVLLSDVRCRADVHLLHGARVAANVRADGTVRVLGARISGDVWAGGDVEVRPPAVLLGAVECRGRVLSLEGFETQPTAPPAAAPAPSPPDSTLVLEPL